jgi:hypothetical protein
LIACVLHEGGTHQKWISRSGFFIVPCVSMCTFVHLVRRRRKRDVQLIHNNVFIHTSVFVYLSPELGCFLGPMPVVTKLPLRAHGIPPSGVGQHERASLFSVEGTIAYLMDLMRTQCFHLSLVEQPPKWKLNALKKQLIWSYPWW